MSPRNQSTTDLDAIFLDVWISEFSRLQARVSLEEAFARDFSRGKFAKTNIPPRDTSKEPRPRVAALRGRAFAFRNRERGVVAASRRPMTLRPLAVQARTAEDVHPRQPLHPPSRRHAIAPAHELALACSSMCTGCRGLTPRHVVENKLRADRFIFFCRGVDNIREISICAMEEY